MLDLGLRERAAQLLKSLSDRICEGVDTATREPFLAVSSRYDEPTPDASLTDYVAISVNEQLERSRAYASFFTRDSARVVLKRAGKPELLSMDMIRRIALISQRQNQPYPPQIKTRLITPSTENINAHLWR